MAAFIDEDVVADNILFELLKNNGFIEILEKRVEDELLQKQKEKIGEEDYTEEPKHGQNTDLQPFKDLIVSVNNSIEKFLENEEFLFFIYECAHNRQLSCLYDVQVFLDRLENATDTSDENSFKIRITSCARRLSQLSRHFTVSFCSRDKSINISHIHHFVISFCEMLYRIESLLRSIKGTEELSLGIRRCADNYNIMVFKKISLVYQQKLKENLKFMKKEENRRMTLTPKPAKRKPLLQVQGRSPGFLMSPQLLKDRQRIQRTRISFAPEIDMKSSFIIKQARNPEKVVEAAKQMEEKWKHFFDSNARFKNSIKHEPKREDSASMRFARELSAGIAKEIRNQVEDDGEGLI
ncbi:unnamed protein product [Auanema sp. JU1783]|nr:unnamed protein product [Auanema sp. JU1783]